MTIQRPNCMKALRQGSVSISLSPAARSCAGPCPASGVRGYQDPAGGHEEGAVANHRARSVSRDAALRIGCRTPNTRRASGRRRHARPPAAIRGEAARCGIPGSAAAGSASGHQRSPRRVLAVCLTGPPDPLPGDHTEPGSLPGATAVGARDWHKRGSVAAPRHAAHAIAGS